MKPAIFYKNYISNNPARLILFMYIVSIIIGTILLMLPISSSGGEWTSLIDAFFTIVSSVCVTGLTTVATAIHWSTFGKVIILLWIQLGGLGVMTAASMVALIFNKKMSISDRLKLSEEKNATGIEGIVRIIKFILLSTFLAEAIGAIFLSFTFVKDFGLAKGIFYGIFHSISAFCNAGFDLIGEQSLTPYATNLNISLVISLLIIVGGIGHTVIKEILVKKFRFRKYSVHTKLTLLITLGLLIIPTLWFLVIEFNNPETLGNYSFFHKIIVAFFQSTTTRTAGFYTSNQAMYLNASMVITIMLMFIGGSPAGTAGGFKTTTFAALFLITKSNVTKNKDISLFKRRLPEEISEKVIAIFTISLTWIVGVVFLITLFEPTINTLDIVYEVISAYATVGLTRGITSDLTIISKLIIAATMIFGKVGPISIIVAFIDSDKHKTYREQKVSILIG